MSTKRIQLISGPRNISTALMYAFGNRQDCGIVDEPFYAHYLDKHQVDHPGKEEIIQSQRTEISKVLEEVIFAYCPTDILFIKNMAHHYIGLDPSILNELSNVFLIRDPKQLICSFSQVIPNPTMQDIGIKHEFDLYKHSAAAERKNIIIDAGEVLKNPEKILKQLCDHCQIPFTNQMLNWEAGPRKEDGVWAKYWYKNVHQSTGFKKQSQQERSLPEQCIPLFEEAKIYYDQLFDLALKA